MPVMDGTAATSRLVQIFSENPLMKTPIIAVTAANYQGTDEFQRILSVGFVDIRKYSSYII